MAKGIGIDIGSKSLKIVELEFSGGKYRINHFIERVLTSGSNPEENPDVLISPIADIFREYRLNPDITALAVPSQDCILSDFYVDFTSEEHIHKIIKYEAENHLHSYQIEDVIIDYHKLEVQENRTRLLMAAAPKRIIAQRLDVLQSCNIDPVAIELDIMALVNAVSLSPQMADKEAVVLIDFGAGSTKVILLFQGQIRYVRSTRLGADRLTATLQKDLEVDYETVREKMSQRVPRQQETGDFEHELILSLSTLDDEVALADREYITQRPYEEWEGDWIEQKKEEFFDRLTKELKRTLLAGQQPEKPFELIALTGGGCQLEGLPEAIEKKFEIPTVRLDLSQALQMPKDAPPDIGLLCPVALGLALKALGKTTMGMDFRKEEFIYTRKFEIIKNALAIASTLGFILFLLLGYLQQRELIKYQLRFNELLEAGRQVAREQGLENRLLDDEPDPFYQLSYLRDMLQSSSGNSGTSQAFPPIVNVLDQWKQLFDRVRQVRRRDYFTIEFLEMLQEGESPLRVTMRGKVGNDAILDRLIALFKTIPGVSRDDKLTRIVSVEKLSTPVKRLHKEFFLEVTYKKSP